MDSINNTEVTYLKDRINKQHEQQCLLEQIVANISSLVEGSGDPMCIFDKDGFFMHTNSACRKLLGITEQHTSQKNIFDYYSPHDRDRIFKEVVQRRATKWSGHVSFSKPGGHEMRVTQVIELLISSKNNLDGTFFKSYMSIQHDHTHDKLQFYYEMIRHMPVGVGIWRLEKGYNSSTLRLVCANSLAAQYVGVTLHVGKDIHETLPNGGEVHQFLVEVIKGQRVSTLEKFRIAYGREVAVTAFPLSQEYVAVVLETPKKDSWGTALDFSSLGIAVCEGLRIGHCNDAFIQILGGMKEVTGKDVISLLEPRSTGRAALFDLRRAMLEARIHNAEVEVDQHQWGVCVHPLVEGSKSSIMLVYRITIPKATPVIHRGTYPILPHLREALPLPTTPHTQPQVQPQVQPQSPLATQHTTPTPKATPNIDSMDNVFRELVDNFPCGIAIVKAERHQDVVQFRIVSINRAARVFSTHLVVGKYFDERSPSPFDAAFVRLLLGSYQTHERRVASRLNLYGSCLSLAARTIPLHDHCIGIAFEEASVVLPQSSPSYPHKRSHSEIDSGHHVLPSHNKHPCSISPQPSPTPQASSQISVATPTSQHTLTHTDTHEVASAHRVTDTPRRPSRQLAPSLVDIERLPISLPKPYLPPIHSTASSVSTFLGSRENFELDVFQHCVNGIACSDVKGQLSFVNRSFCHMLGFSEHEFSEKSVLTFVSADDVEAMKAAMKQLVNGECSTVDIPLRLLHKRSHTVTALVTIHISKTPGERTYLLLQAQQAASLRQYTEVLFSEKESLHLAYKDLFVGSAVMSFGGAAPTVQIPTPMTMSFVSANASFCDMLGVTEDALLTARLIDFIHIEDRERATKIVQDLLAQRSSRNQTTVRVIPKACGASTLITTTPSVPLPPTITPTILSISTIVNSRLKPFLLVVQLQPVT